MIVCSERVKVYKDVFATRDGVHEMYEVRNSLKSEEMTVKIFIEVPPHKEQTPLWKGK